MANVKIEKEEIKFAFIGIAIIMFWFLVARPWIAPYLQALPPIIAMLIFNMGLLVGLLFMSSMMNGHKFSMKFSIMTFIILIGINILTPPYLVEANGLVHTEVDYWYVAADASIGTFWASFLPQAWVWTFTYIISPILLIVLIPIIISDPKTIKKTMGV